MIAKRIILVLVFHLFITTGVLGAQMTQIWYQVEDIGPERWQYTYEVINVALPAAIQEFTIHFDSGLYENLSVTTLDPPAGDWDEMAWEPAPGLWDGGYDSLALGTGIRTAESVAGFCVTFDWLGAAEPGPQFYEVIDPADHTTLDSGFTVPEPGMIALFGLGILMSRRFRRT